MGPPRGEGISRGEDPELQGGWGMSGEGQDRRAVARATQKFWSLDGWRQSICG